MQFILNVSEKGLIMRKWTVATALIITTSILPTSAYSHDIPISSVNGLLTNCTYQSNDQTEVEFHAGMCLGFLKAIMNTHPTYGETFCLPYDMNNSELVEVIREALYLVVGEYGDQPSHIVIGGVYEAAFPCD